MNDNFAFLFQEEINEYDFGEGHPFHSRRGEDFLKFFKDKIKIDFPILKAKKATKKDLLLICEEDYIDFTRNFFKSAFEGKKINGRFFQYHSVDNLPIGKPGNIEEAARYILGQAKLACDLVAKGKFEKVISIGGGLHHAKRNFGEGFCLYNDVALCALYLKKKYNFEKIMIIDTDAHCGNGTMEYFYDDKKVLFLDLHQDPRTIYPGTGFVEQMGRGEGLGFTLNIPLPPGAGDRSYQLVFEKIVEPIAKEFSPQIIIRNGGSDPHFSDKLTNLGLTIDGFKMIGEKIRKIAEICGGKEIDLIASGYNFEILPSCWTALIFGLLGIGKNLEKEKTSFLEKESVIKETEKIIERIRESFKTFWKCFR